MALFAIGDTHLSFATNKPMDIFGGWKDYVTRLEKNWKSIVKDTDTVLIAGDISWAMNFEQLKLDFAFLESLPGEKIILKGNHDYWWNTMKKMREFIDQNGYHSIKILHNNAYEVDGFVVCGSRGWFYDASGADDEKVLAREVGRLKMSIEKAKELDGELVLFLHYPPVMGNETCDPIMQVIKDENIEKCFYGHLHGDFSKVTPEQIIDKTRFSLISCDYLKFCPKLISKN